MTKAQVLRRQKAAASAIGSVKAEGLTVSIKTKNNLKKYANGKITREELNRITIRGIKSRNK